MDASPPAAAPAPSWPRRIVAIAERLAVAHFLGYPIAFLWAVAAIPLTIHLHAAVLERLEADQVGQYVVRRLLWPAGAAFALAHTTAIPWLVVRDPKRGLRLSLLSIGALAGVGAAFGAASWLWLLLR